MNLNNVYEVSPFNFRMGVEKSQIVSWVKTAPLSFHCEREYFALKSFWYFWALSARLNYFSIHTNLTK